MKKSLVIIGLLLYFVIAQSCSNDLAAQHESVYAGQENREIKSLSKSDIDDLRNGKGWGLAKAAELNGVPGPVHLIEMKKELGLSEEQVTQIQLLYDQMKNDAIPLGQKLIELEKKLDASFAGGSIDKNGLERQLGEIAEVYKNLRFVHLSAHLSTPKILTAEQIKVYRKMRGYSSGDPCSSVPKGHDPEMWKRHNNCK